MASRSSASDFDEKSHTQDETESDITKTGATMMPDTAEKDKVVDLEEQTPAAPPKPLGLGDPSSFPDGGLTAWSVVAGAWCCLFVR